MNYCENVGYCVPKDHDSFTQPLRTLQKVNDLTLFTCENVVLVRSLPVIECSSVCWLNLHAAVMVCCSQNV